MLKLRTCQRLLSSIQIVFCNTLDQVIVLDNCISIELYRQLVLNRVITPGVYYSDNGNIVFDRLSIEDYIQKVRLGMIDNIAYYTRSMGRGIFTVGSNGEIINTKGVDSNLNLGEVKRYDISSLLGRKQRRHEIVVTYFNHGSYSGHKKKPQIRVKGASQLQDLLSEYEKIEKYKSCKLLKLPRICQLTPLSKGFCQKYNLPSQVELTDEFLKSMQIEDSNDKRKGIVEKSRIHCLEQLKTIGVPDNTRYQTWQEYFFSLSDQEKKLVQNVPEINDAIIEEDRRYGLGAMFGQATRILENPFRISDLAYYNQHKNIEAISDIIRYSQLLYDEDYLLTYAATMGRNVAGFMNQKLANHLWSHRQDFALSAEICDEAYNDVSVNLSKDDCFDTYIQLKASASKCTTNDCERIEYIENDYEEISVIVEDQAKYYTQFFLFGSNMKVIEDAYKLLDYSIPVNYQNSFIRSFIDNLENKETIVNEIKKWSSRLFGISGELGTVLGKRAINNIAGFEYYIDDLYQRLIHC